MTESTLPQRKKPITAFMSPILFEGYNLKALSRKRLWKAAANSPLETHRRAITMLTFQKEKGARAFSYSSIL